MRPDGAVRGSTGTGAWIPSEVGATGALGRGDVDVRVRMAHRGAPPQMEGAPGLLPSALRHTGPAQE